MLRERARALKTDVPAVYLAMRSKDTPWYAKALAGLTVVYALSPVDLIPDFIPVLGYLDDLIILPALVALTARLIPPAVFAVCRGQAKGLDLKKRWYCALPVVLVWLVLLAALMRAVFFSSKA
ncbi:MAG: YkvA family protein [Oscillospiraceae bacterium]|nr:YkvA family protein [Oscillospiraceae bacterium]